MVINPYIFKREPNTFIGGIAKLGGTGANAPILTAAELAAKMGISESIIKGFKVVGEDVECRITSDYNLIQNAFGHQASGDANQNITFFNDIDNKCIGSERHSFANCFNLLSVVMNGLKNNVLAVSGGTNGGIFRNCTSMISAELDSLEILNCYEFMISTKITNVNLPSLEIILDTASTRYRNFQNMTELNILSARKLKQIGADASINNNNFLGIKLNATIEVHIDLATANNGDIDADLLYAYNSRNATINFYDDNGDFVETYNP